MAERTSTCDVHIENPQVYLNVPRPFSFVTWPPEEQGEREWRWRKQRPGAALLATKITCSNAMRFLLWKYVKDSVFLRSVPQEQLEVWRRIIAAISGVFRDMLQRVWAEKDYPAWCLLCYKGGQTEHSRGRQKQTYIFPLCACMSCVTIARNIQV